MSSPDSDRFSKDVLLVDRIRSAPNLQ